MLASKMLPVMSLLIVMTMAQTQEFITQCSDNSALPLNAFINCTDFECCHVMGEAVIFDIEFITKQPITSSTLEIKVVTNTDIYTVSSYPPPEPDACLKLKDASCPLDADQTVNYESTYVVPTFPQTTVNFVEFRIVNQDDETQTCFVQVIKAIPAGQTCD